MYHLRRARYFERRYDLAQAYLRGLRNLILYKRILLKIDEERVMNLSRDPIESAKHRLGLERSDIRFKPTIPPLRPERQFYGLDRSAPVTINAALSRLIDRSSPNAHRWTASSDW